MVHAIISLRTDLQLQQLRVHFSNGMKGELTHFACICSSRSSLGVAGPVSSVPLLPNTQILRFQNLRIHGSPSRLLVLVPGSAKIPVE
jgi:hypothetical protein